MTILKKHSVALCLSVVMTTCVSTALAQESQLAVYITVKHSKKCENVFEDVTNKKYCLAPQPVLTKADFSYITDIKIDLAMRSYFSLVFTENGATKLKNLAIGFPNTQIVLVVDKTIIGFLTDLDQLKSNSLKMTGSKYGNDIDFVHSKLQAFLPVKK